MVRYVHHQLMIFAEAGCAVAITAPVVFGVRGVPTISSELWLTFLVLGGVTAAFGVLACSRWSWLGGEKRDFETAVPLANAKAVLPAPKEALRRSFYGGFVALLVVPCLVVGLIWEPLVVFWPFVFVPDRAVKGVYAASWERRHGVLLWRGHVEEQPLGKGQFLYSSERLPTPG